MLTFLLRNIKDLPQIVGLFCLEIELASNKWSDKCEKAQGSINKYVKNGLVLGIFSNTRIITTLQTK